MSFQLRAFTLRGPAVLLASLAVLTLTGQVALAQDSDTTDEIIVTVRQRAESIKDVPGAVTAFSAEQIEATGIQRARDFLYQTPGVSIVNAAEVADSQVNIRGINGARDAESNYALIIDGILMTNPAALNREYTNLQQIEILKGPQGALYGRNAAAGAIIIETNKPGDVFGGKVQGSMAEDSTYVISGDVGGPVSDTLGFTLTGSFRDTDGFYRNAYSTSQRNPSPGENNIVDQFQGWDVGGRLIWQPSDALTVDAKLRYGQVEAGSITFNSVFEIPSLVPVLAGFGPEFASKAYENVNNHAFQFDNNIKPFNNQDATEFSVKADYDLGWADLTGWGLYSDIENDLGADGTSGAFGFFNAETQCKNTVAALAFYPVAPPQFINTTPPGSILGAYTPTACDGTQYQKRDQTDYSFEVRLASKGDQPLRWLGGLYYLNIDREVGVNTGIDRGAGITENLYVRNNGPSTTNPTEQLADDQFTTDVYSVFGQLAYDVTDTIEASLALRWDREERKVHSKVPTPADGAVTEYIDTCGNGSVGGDPINPGLCVPGGAQGTFEPIAPQKKTFDKLEPKLSFTWDATENQTAYASVGVGFKSGGFNNSGSAETVNKFINCGIGIGSFANTTFEGQTCGTRFGAYPAVDIQNNFDEETSTSYEAGLKSTWFDRSVRTELAVYRVEVKDMQFFEFVVGGFGLLRVVSNIDKVDIEGIEASVTWATTDWLDLYAGINYTDSEIKENASRPDSVGNRSPYTPDYTYNFGGRVTYPMSGSLDFVGSLDVSGVGDTWFHVIQANDRPTGFSALFGIGPGNYAITKRDPYALVNLRAGVSGGNWSLVGFINNVFDDNYLEEVIPAPEFGGAFIHPGSERRAGVEASYKF